MNWDSSGYCKVTVWHRGGARNSPAKGQSSRRGGAAVEGNKRITTIEIGKFHIISPVHAPTNCQIFPDGRGCSPPCPPSGATPVWHSLEGCVEAMIEINIGCIFLINGNCWKEWSQCIDVTRLPDGETVLCKSGTFYSLTTCLFKRIM